MQVYFSNHDVFTNIFVEKFAFANYIFRTYVKFSTHIDAELFYKLQQLISFGNFSMYFFYMYSYHYLNVSLKILTQVTHSSGTRGV